MNILALAIIVVVFLVVTAVLGFMGFRRTKDSTDYLLAGRKIHPVVMALSYGATFISTSAIIGFGGAAAVYGMGVIWLTFMNILVGIFIAFVFFGRRTRKMGHNLDAHTFPEFLAKRYDSRFLQLGGGTLVFVAMPLYAGSVIIGGVQFISQTLKINYEIALLFFVAVVALYVVMGGLKGVMYADAFQGSLMFLGMLFLLIFTYVELGGVRAANQALTDMAPVAKSVFGANGHQGWTSMPELFSPYWWQLVSTIVLGVGIGVLAQPQLTVRFMTVKSGHELNRAVLIGGVFIAVMTGVAFTVFLFPAIRAIFPAVRIKYTLLSAPTVNATPVITAIKTPPIRTVRFMTVKSGHELNRAVLIGGVFIAVMTGVAFTVGALSNVYFMRTAGKIALIAGNKKTDSIIPLFIDQALPPWFVILFFVTLLGAAMSTLSSQFHTMGTAIGRDVLEKGLSVKAKNTVAVNRIAMGAGILLSTLIAYFLPLFYAGGTAIIATGTAIFFGLCASAFLPSYIGALYSRKVSREAAVACFISGVSVTLFWLFFVHAKESVPFGLCKLLFGKQSLFPAMQNVDPILIALPISSLIYLVVNRVTRPVDEEITQKAFNGVISA